MASAILDLARSVRAGSEISRDALAAALEGMTILPPASVPADVDLSGGDIHGMESDDETPQHTLVAIPDPRGKENQRPADPHGGSASRSASRRRVSCKTFVETPCEAGFSMAAAHTGSA